MTGVGAGYAFGAGVDDQFLLVTPARPAGIADPAWTLD